jgi:hypothetical protein
MRGEASLPPFSVSEHMVVRLGLIPTWSKQWLGVRSKKSHPLTLIALPSEPHPEKMHVVRHQTITRTNQPFASTCVDEYLTKLQMKFLGKPARSAVRNWEGPVDHRVTSIEFRLQAREVIHRMVEQR